MIRYFLDVALYVAIGFLFAVLNSWVVEAFERRWEVAVFIIFWPIILVGECIMVLGVMLWSMLKAAA